MRKAGWNVASAIGEGLLGGLGHIAGKVIERVNDIIGGLSKAAKKVLGIKSPSKVFTIIGQQTMGGMALGLQNGGQNAVKTMESTTNAVIDTAQGALGKIPNLLDGLVDIDPVITPVLDLTNVEKGAEQLADLTNVTPITAAASYGQAAVISEEQMISQTAQAETDTAVSSVTFEQNNYSPEALSAIEIYRQTNNQLSQAKSALGV